MLTKRILPISLYSVSRETFSICCMPKMFHNIVMGNVSRAKIQNGEIEFFDEHKMLWKERKERENVSRETKKSS